MPLVNRARQLAPYRTGTLRRSIHAGIPVVVGIGAMLEVGSSGLKRWGGLVDEEFLEEGTMFDGSSIAGWKGIQASDMLLMPDVSTAFVDPVLAVRSRSKARLEDLTHPAAVSVEPAAQPLTVWWTPE